MSLFAIVGHPEMRYNATVKKDFNPQNQLNNTPQPASAGFFNASFLMIPKALLYGSEFEQMSICAKILYALMKDRLALSEKNGWKDDCGRTFIYFKQLDAAKILGCGRTSAVKYMHELENCGLIQKTSQGLGKPDIIYINELCDVQETHAQNRVEPEEKELCPNESHHEKQSSKNFDVQILRAQKMNTPCSKNELLDVQNLNTNNTKKSNTENNYTEGGGIRPPTVEEAEKYCKENSLDVDAEYFVNFYEAQGWYIGRTKMRDWRAKLRAWHAENKRRSNEKPFFKGKTQLEMRHDYDVKMLERALFGEDGG